MRAALVLLMMLLVALTAAGCGGPASGELEASRDRAEEQHGGEEPADAAKGESEVEGADESVEEDESSAPDQEIEAGEESEDTGVEEKQNAQEGTDAGATADVDLDQGRQLFSQSCASCHALSDAEATGAIGPSLDAAADDLTAEGVLQQIINGGNGMPPGLLQGEDAETVAGYVDQVAGQ